MTPWIVTTDRRMSDPRLRDMPRTRYLPATGDSGRTTLHSRFDASRENGSRRGRNCRLRNNRVYDFKHADNILRRAFLATSRAEILTLRNAKVSIGQQLYEKRYLL
jgi:hypothetical protein